MGFKSLMSTIFVKPFVAAFKFFTSNDAVTILQNVVKLADIAVPVVEKVAGLKLNPDDALVVKALANLGLTAPQIISQADKHFRNGMQLSLAAEALKLHLIELVSKGEKIELADFTLRTAADVLNIDPETLRSAAQDAYTVWKKLQPKK